MSVNDSTGTRLAGRLCSFSRGIVWSTGKVTRKKQGQAGKSHFQVLVSPVSVPLV